jgi:hypothetical protein
VLTSPKVAGARPDEVIVSLYLILPAALAQPLTEINIGDKLKRLRRS